MKKLILSAIALVSLTCQAVAQAPEGPNTTPVVTPPPVPTPAPAPATVPTQPTNQKEKAEKQKGDSNKNKGGERAWENHRKSKKDDKGKKEERKEQKVARKEQKVERKEQKTEQKVARAEKLDKMRAYLNLSPDQESRMSTAIQAFRTGAKAVKENKNLSAEQKKVQFDKLVAERNAQLKSILSPEQLAKLAEAQKQAQAQGQGNAKNGFISDEIGDDDLF